MITILLIALYLLIGAWIFQISHRTGMCAYGDASVIVFLWPICITIELLGIIDMFMSDICANWLIKDAQRRK